jgi:hypothetical protein
MVEQISSRVVYTNPWMTIREDEIVHADGTPGIWSCPGLVDTSGLSATRQHNRLRQWA